MDSKITLPTGSFASRHNANDQESFRIGDRAFEDAKISLRDKLEAYPRFVSKRSIARFMVKEKLFEKVLNTTGIIVECGVLNGAGLFTWAHLSNIFEPINYTRKIVGFDTFEGFPSVDEKTDNAGSLKSKVGDLRGSTVADLEISIQKYNHERHLAHIPNMQLVKGDINLTAGKFLEDNPHVIVSLLYLDFDLYEPTKVALETFFPRMPKGSIIAFDEINCETFPGETTALNEVIGLGKYAIQRFPIDPWISYIQL